MRYRLFLYSFLCLALAGCGRIYEQHYAFDGRIWKYDAPVRMEVPVDKAGEYELYLMLRHSGRYDFRNLWWTLQTESPGGQSRTDSMNLTLASADGEWLGSSLGDFHDMTYNLTQKPMRLTETGTYKLTLRHAMRPDTLYGMIDVGVRLKRVD